MTARPPRFLAILPILPMDLRRMIQARWTPADVATLLLVSKSWSENVLLLKALLAAANKKMEEQKPRCMNCEAQSEGHRDRGDPYVAIDEEAPQQTIAEYYDGLL
jgi:hypothetical protein